MNIRKKPDPQLNQQSAEVRIKPDTQPYVNTVHTSRVFA